MYFSAVPACTAVPLFSARELLTLLYSYYCSAVTVITHLPDSTTIIIDQRQVPITAWIKVRTCTCVYIEDCMYFR